MRKVRVIKGNLLWVSAGTGGGLRNTFPLTFEEFYNYRKLDKSDVFREYLMFGGLPFI